MKEIDNLIDCFANSAIIYCDEMTKNADLSNKYYDITTALFFRITECADWIDSFSKLLKHPHVGVQVTSAYHLLPYRPIYAMYTLLRCSLSNSGTESFNAKLILEMWLSGHLTFPQMKNGEIVYTKKPKKY